MQEVAQPGFGSTWVRLHSPCSTHQGRPDPSCKPQPSPGQVFSETLPVAYRLRVLWLEQGCGMNSCLRGQFFWMVCILLLANSWSSFCSPLELPLWYWWPSPPLYPVLSHSRSFPTSNLPLTFRVQDGILDPIVHRWPLTGKYSGLLALFKLLSRISLT